MKNEPRVMVIDGQRVAVFDRTPPVPGTLDLMLNGGRDPSGYPWPAFRPTVTYTLHLTGARPECAVQDHRLKPWLEGFQSGSDGVTRYLHLNACVDCGSVCVRDASYDSLADYDPAGRGAAVMSRLRPRRKDHVIGWYTGARPRQRVYT